MLIATLNDPVITTALRQSEIAWESSVLRPSEIRAYPTHGYSRYLHCAIDHAPKINGRGLLSSPPAHCIFLLLVGGSLSVPQRCSLSCCY